MELSGTIKIILEEKKFPSGFAIKEFVITTSEDRYPQEILLQFSGDKISALASCNVGDTVKVQFDIRGRESNGRYYNSLAAWKIDREGAGNAPEPQSYASSAPSSTPPPAPAPAPMDAEDDLPF